MDTNIFLHHAFENHTMAFCGLIKQERWNRIFWPIDDMIRIAMSRALGEGVFNYEDSWRTNNDILGKCVGYLARVGVEKWDIVRLSYNLFNPCWLLRLEIVVANIDERL